MKPGRASSFLNFFIITPQLSDNPKFYDFSSLNLASTSNYLLHKETNFLSLCKPYIQPWPYICYTLCLIYIALFLVCLVIYSSSSLTNLEIVHYSLIIVSVTPGHNNSHKRQTQCLRGSDSEARHLDGSADLGWIYLHI